MRNFLLYLLTSFCFISCEKDEPAHITILERQILNEIYSLSGIEKYKDNFFIISDNSPWLLKLNDKFEILDSVQIASTEKLEGYYIAPEHKPDFEGITKIEIEGLDELIVLGSGSKFPERNLLIRIQLRNKVVKSYRMDEFFQKILKTTGIQESELNIEGMAVYSDKFYFLNRGNNAILEYDLQEFISYLESGNNCPIPKEYVLSLPEIDGVQASLSGANVVKKGKRIIFSASVEDTDNWLNDGEVLGSFICFINIAELSEHSVPTCIPISENDSILALKVESIAAVKQIEKDDYEMQVVTDSDGGFSEILKLHVHF